ncbi:hypothetical protein HRR83_006031 [Exophiala dermatitidis]|nr:hypothetical protein HRR74_005428 [Exophiala dermatitidis]KAJ4517454.1 hypothetical protein HRR73_004506 [Exophiala dermatitidis]KAJ4548793.1 hypothetical protein HRR76_001373 [Exophiala dermatitidis]KAJ4552488.1 hypothetical protein HRR77_002497 [Exophiala dermatitidis]KAJ4566997.1 hypothetical protein HRR81_007073 [Exophiala dermatitidis]
MERSGTPPPRPEPRPPTPVTPFPKPAFRDAAPLLEGPGTQPPQPTPRPPTPIPPLSDKSGGQDAAPLMDGPGTPPPQPGPRPPTPRPPISEEHGRDAAPFIKRYDTPPLATPTPDPGPPDAPPRPDDVAISGEYALRPTGQLLHTASKCLQSCRHRQGEIDRGHNPCYLGAMGVTRSDLLGRIDVPMSRFQAMADQQHVPCLRQCNPR